VKAPAARRDGAERVTERARRYVTPRGPGKSRPGPTSAFGARESAAPVAVPAPAPTPAPAKPPPLVTAWTLLGPQLKTLLDPVYVAIGAAPVAVEGWTMFSESWGAVVDHYFPLGAGPWPPALLSTVIVGAPLVAVVIERRQAKAAAPTPAAPAAPAARGPQLAKLCYDLHARGARDHPTQPCPAGCECACHQGLPP
jgi:hypothetical protein